MATYVIGDIHGCWDALQRLLRKISWDPTGDRLLLVGDLINGGEDSLAVLRWAAENPAIDSVLGNHDFHLLAVAHGVRALRAKDSLHEVLAAPDRDHLIDWLRQRPLMIRPADFPDVVLTHAGIPPCWSISEARQRADEIASILRRADFIRELETLFGHEPTRWDPSLPVRDLNRFTVNAFCQMRVLRDTRTLDLKYKGGLEGMPPALYPWFMDQLNHWPGYTIIHGHWAALGRYRSDCSWNLDSGCVWGGELTALRLEDRRIYSVPSDRPISRDE